MSGPTRVAGRLVLGAALLCVAAAGPALVLLHVQLLVVRSGSMSPALDTGAIAVSVPVDAQRVGVGDVVTVEDSDGAMITHRVVLAEPVGSSVSLTLKGDANPSVDPEPYVVDRARRVIWSAPRLGYVVAVLGGPVGSAVWVTVALLLLARRGSRGGRRRSGAAARDRGAHREGPPVSSRSPMLIASSAVLLGAACTVHGVLGTWAAYADTAELTGPAFSAATVSAPTGVTCVNSGTQDYITWTPPPGPAPTAYRVHVNGAAVATAEVAATVTQWRPGTTFFPQTYANVRIVAVRGSWTSAPSTTADSISTLFLFQGTSC